MRFAIAGLLAVWALLCTGVRGQGYAGGIDMDNIYNTSTDAHATTNGLVWIDTGSGPALLNQDIDIQMLCGGAANSLALMKNLGYDGTLTYGPQYSTWLISDGTATDFGQSGMGDGTFFGGGDIIDPFGVEWVTYQTSTLPDAGNFYFQLLMWTGTYNTYADAYAASAKGTADIFVGTTPVFINSTANGPMPPNDLTNMPAVILTRGLPGDANIDGRVDINDLTIVLAHYNQSGTWSSGEFTGSGTVDINDLTIVLANYNSTIEAPRTGAWQPCPSPACLRCWPQVWSALPGRTCRENADNRHWENTRENVR